MRNIFAAWTYSKVTTPSKRSEESITDALIKTNAVFKNFLTNYSWYVYLIAGFLVLCSTFYYIYDCKRRLDLSRRRQQLQRAQERVPQHRRPGAVHREHEIFRNVVKTVHQYMAPKDSAAVKQREYTLKRTRSGTVYGYYSDQDN